MGGINPPQDDRLAGRRRTLQGLGSLLGLAISPALVRTAAATPAAWVPEKPITILVGFAAGGSADQIARNLASAARHKSPVPVVVMNKPGAAGAVAAQTVAQTAPDGYTLFVGGGSETTSLGNHQQLSYDPRSSFRAIIKVARLPSVLVVRADSPYPDMRALLAAAKAAPEKLSYGSTGHGGIFHSTALILEKISAIRLLHVPYKGAAESMAALAGGQIDMAFGAPEEVQGLVAGGRLRPIAIFSNSRVEAYPDVPTMTELGYPVAVDNMKGLLAPKGLPDNAYQWLFETFHDAMQSPEFLQYAKSSGLSISYADGPAFQREINDSFEAIKKAIQQ
ncbi:Bug family tripartite tricarboxylate transporter substrate binding protein [Achromobacter deleyi]|uniref:Bug family tripartite tricarboxylate transporter substrate binding protein n=1 Tax=Achromobacter deleyi TaxID=1353891 RepID=UPI001491D08E|nr:tripartite tricarboxylate transporter substrate binding protein [Achromobacter deleyi]QVQ26425.1 tripartite tricarboxylate transporter substrate binding protein [Achromobacter deleyi]UIP21993.1 tripartite tricarboxylate transporter substrate binding protein [Achromobacter deleyi]